MKTKLRGYVEVIQDDNDELTMGDDIFQLGELVYPYRVALSNNLEKNLNFHIVKNIFVDVDIEVLNNILRSSKHT
jgi:hypothetical protein